MTTTKSIQPDLPQHIHSIQYTEIKDNNLTSGRNKPSSGKARIRVGTRIFTTDHRTPTQSRLMIDGLQRQQTWYVRPKLKSLLSYGICYQQLIFPQTSQTHNVSQIWTILIATVLLLVTEPCYHPRFQATSTQSHYDKDIRPVCSSLQVRTISMVSHT